MEEFGFALLDIDYTMRENNPVIRMYGKKNDEEVIVEDDNFRPYFYAIPRDIEKAIDEIKDTEFTDKDGNSLNVLKIEKTTKEFDDKTDEVIKITTDVPTNVSKIKSQTYDLQPVKNCREYDIPFYKRYLIDKQIKPTKNLVLTAKAANKDRTYKLDEIKGHEEKEIQELSIMAFDLEVVNDELIMASFYSEDYKKVLTLKESDKEYAEQVKNEEKLYKKLLEIVNKQNPDIITGYNSDEFDFKILRSKAEKYNQELKISRNDERMKFKRRGRFSSARIKGRPHLDLYPFVTHVLAPGLDSETLDLDSVVEELLGKNKDDVEFSEMREWWQNNQNLDKIVQYNLRDSEITYELAKEIIPQIIELSRITGLIPFDACRLTYGQLTENYLLREAFKRNKIAPNRPLRKEQRKRQREGAYEGGFVYEPDAGLYEGISVFDFRSLYPTVMVAHNISPEVLNKENCSSVYEIEELGYEFCQDEQGFFPELIEDLVSSRTKLKEKLKQKDDSIEKKSLDNRQNAQKILANSFYGYLGYNGARWYSKECAQATTHLGRKYIEDSIKTAEELGFEVIYGDTDSVFLKETSESTSREKFLDEVNDNLPEFMELEFEGFFKTGLFTSTDEGRGAKKKYALMDEDGNLKITGFEQVRRDWSPIAKETQEKVLRKVLNGNVKEAADLVKETVEKLEQGEIPIEKLKIYTKLTKSPEKYDSKAPHVEAVKKARKMGEEIEAEATIDYVITNRGGSISEKAEMTKYADSYDAKYYIENQLVPVCYRVLKVFGYTEDQLKGKGKQSGLQQFK